MTALGGFAQPSCDYNNRVLQGAGTCCRHRLPSLPAWQLHSLPYVSALHVAQCATTGNWFEDRFLEAEGTAVDPVLRPYSGPEEPLVGATKGVKGSKSTAIAVLTDYLVELLTVVWCSKTSHF